MPFIHYLRQAKTLLVAILILAVIALWSISNHQAHRISRIREERDQVIQFAKGERNQIEYYRNTADRETARAHVLDLTLKNTRELINTDRLSFIKHFNGINKRLNNLEQVSQTTAQVVSQWEIPLRDTVIVEMDSTIKAARVFEFRDSLNQISGIIIGNQVKPKIEITVPLQGVVYWQRAKVFGLRMGRKKWFSDISSTNPSVRIKTHETINVKRK